MLRLLAKGSRSAARMRIEVSCQLLIVEFCYPTSSEGRRRRARPTGSKSDLFLVGEASDLSSFQQRRLPVKDLDPWPGQAAQCTVLQLLSGSKREKWQSEATF